MKVEGKRLGIFSRRTTSAALTETSIKPPGFGSGLILEPATGEEREKLERSCDEIFSLKPEYFSWYHFTDYVDAMIKLLGTPDRIPHPEGRYTSANVVFKNDEIEGTIRFSKDSEYRGHTINIAYINQLSEKAYFNGEEVKLSPYVDTSDFGETMFADVTYFPNPSRISMQYLNSLTSDQPIELEIPIEQKASLTPRETLGFLAKTYGLYQRWKAQKETPNPQVP